MPVGRSLRPERNAWEVTVADVALPTTGRDAVQFSAYAFNGDGVKSDTHRMSYAIPEIEANRRHAFVIAVGVNAYENRSWDLRYAAADARAGADIVTRHLEASGEFDEVHTVLLVAERGAGGAIDGAATRAELLAVLDVLAGNVGGRELVSRIPGAGSLRRATPDDFVYLLVRGPWFVGWRWYVSLFPVGHRRGYGTYRGRDAADPYGR